MASKYILDLENVAQELENEGWNLKSSICKVAAERMQRMEDYIVNMENNTEDDWYNELEEIKPEIYGE